MQGGPWQASQPTKAPEMTCSTYSVPQPILRVPQVGLASSHHCCRQLGGRKQALQGPVQICLLIGDKGQAWQGTKGEARACEWPEVGLEQTPELTGNNSAWTEWAKLHYGTLQCVAK